MYNNKRLLYLVTFWAKIGLARYQGLDIVNYFLLRQLSFQRSNKQLWEYKRLNQILNNLANYLSIYDLLQG